MARRVLSWVLWVAACSGGGSPSDGAQDTDVGSTETSQGSSPDPSSTSGGQANTGDGTTADSSDDAGGSDSETSGDPGTTGGTEPVSDPRQPGTSPWSMASHSLDIEGTAIPLTLYLPEGSAPHPVVVVSHGFQLSPSDYASYGEHLASWGYVAVLPQFPGSLFDAPTHAEVGEWLVGIIDWIEAAGSDPQSPLLGRADAGAVGLAGHSMGGKVSFLAASGDARVQAVFGIDPVDAGGGPGQAPSPDYPSVTPELMPLIVVPMAVVGETTNATGGLGQACAPAENNFEQYFMHAQSPALKVDILGANHMSFLDDPNCGLACSVCPAGTDDPTVTRNLTHGYLVAFFGLTLREEAGFAPWLTGAPMQADVDAGLVVFDSANGF